MKYTELIQREIYAGYYGGQKFIFIPNECEMWDNHYKTGNDPLVVKDIVLATHTERMHLAECIRQQKFISLDKIEISYEIY